VSRARARSSRRAAAADPFRIRQVDLTYLVLRGLERLGLVWDLLPGPGEVRTRARRRTRPAAALAALVILALPRPAAGEAEAVERFSGLARAKDGALLYREEHEVRSLGGRVVEATTRYLSADGAPLAELRTDFSLDLEAPSYAFRDLRSGAAEAVEVTERALRLEAGGKSRTLPRRAPIAAGQGLDRLVRERLPELTAGQLLVVNYAIPSRLDTYRFRIRALPDDGGPTVRVRVELASLVLRLLAPDMEVEYDRASRRLLRYRGASNLAFGDRGDHPQVEIRYAYQAAPTAAGKGSDAP
jgi:hypothetical protein